MAATAEPLTDAVATVRSLFDELEHGWDDPTARVRTWHEITDRVADIDKVIRHPEAAPPVG